MRIIRRPKQPRTFGYSKTQTKRSNLRTVRRDFKLPEIFPEGIND